MCGMVKRDRFELSRTSVTVGCGVALLGAVGLHYLRVAQKWDAAFVGTLAPFWYLASVFQSKWRSASFWMALAISFMAHILFIWFVFAVVLRNVNTVGILLWIPAAMLEGIPLYYLIDSLERGIGHLIRVK
jgi:hypothetical protein